MESKSKQIMKFNFQYTQCWMMKLKKKTNLKENKKITRVNLLNPPFRSWDMDNAIERKLK